MRTTTRDGRYGHLMPTLTPVTTGHRLSPRSRALLITATATVLAFGATGCAAPTTSVPASALVAANVSSTTSKTGVAAVVNASTAFLNTLTDAQRSEVLLGLTKDNATAWSNLPCGSTCRVGIQFSTLSTTQLAAAEKLLKTALGTKTGTGYDQVSQIMLADGVLGEAQSSTSTATATAAPTETSTATATSSAVPTDVPTGAPGGGGDGGGAAGGGYSVGNYYLAFLGTPSKTGTWELHFGGHHLAVNISYAKGKVAGGSPFFIGVEPTSWTASDGTTYTPMAKMRSAMLKVTSSLSTSQLAKAKLTESYTDVLLGPDEDGQFPATKSGVKVSSLTHKQQALIMKAIKQWVSVNDNATTKALLKTYKKELAKTYVSYSGTTALTAQGDYVRIDGPSVWIEFVVQNGIVYQNQVHYHTVWRDHTRDYGGEFSF
jgi:hypothetical protein